jgi:hypothetical protein
MSMETSTQPQVPAEHPLREKLIGKLEAAEAENPSFARIATQIIILLTKYTPDTPIPDEFWRLYHQLSKTVNQDSSGTLEFTDTQIEVMVIIRNLMRARGLLLQLPDESELEEKLHDAARDVQEWETVLATSFYPPLLDKAGDEMEIWFFLSLLSRAMVESVDSLDDWDLTESDRAALLLAIRCFPETLIDLFVGNPYLAAYARQQMQLAAESR